MRRNRRFLRRSTPGWDSEGGKCLHRHHPRRDARQEAFPQMRSEHRLENLNAARRPVVDQAATQHHRLGLRHFERYAQLIAAAQPDAQFQFIIQSGFRSESYLAAAGPIFKLAVGAHHGSAADRHRAGPTVITDRQLFGACRHRTPGIRRHPADVIDRAAEVSKSRRFHRQQHLRLLHRHQRCSGGSAARSVASVEVAECGPQRGQRLW